MSRHRMHNCILTDPDTQPQMSHMRRSLQDSPDPNEAQLAQKKSLRHFY